MMMDKPSKICGYFSSESAPPGCRLLHTEHCQYQQEIEHQLKEQQAEIDKLKADIQCMIDKAASKHLPAYREMGEQLAAKDAEIDRLRLALNYIAIWSSNIVKGMHEVQTYAKMILENKDECS